MLMTTLVHTCWFGAPKSKADATSSSGGSSTIMKVYGAASTARNLAEGTHPHPEGEAVQEQDRRNALVLQLAVELGKEVDAKLRQGGEEGLTDQVRHARLVC